MRRVVFVAFLAGVAFAPAALAAPSPAPQLLDRAGDSTVKSHDVVSGRLSSYLSGRTPRLRGELKLLEAPATGLPSNYAFSFGVGCTSYSFTYDWGGGAPDGPAQLMLRDYCTPRDATVVDEPDATFPATVTVKGTTLTWDAAYVKGLKRGTRIQGFSGGACPHLCVLTSMDASEPMVTGDLAWSETTYVLGSDLPRR